MRISAIFMTLIGLSLSSCEAKNPFLLLAEKSKRESSFIGGEFFPFSKTIRNQSIENIDKTWCYANEFSEELINPILRLSDDFSHIDVIKSDNKYEISGKFDGRRNLTAFSGAYETCSGEKGLFVIVSTNDGYDKNPIFVYTDKLENWAHLKIAPQQSKYGDHDSVTIWYCNSCDYYSKIHWIEDEQKFIWKPPCLGICD